MTNDFQERLVAHKQSLVEERERALLRREQAVEVLKRKQLLRPALIERMREDAKTATPFLPPESARSFIKIPQRTTKLVENTGILTRMGVRRSLVPIATITYDELPVWVISMRRTGEGREIPESMGNPGGCTYPVRTVLLDANGDLSAMNNGLPLHGIDKKACGPISFEDILPLDHTNLEDMEGDMPKVVEDWQSLLIELPNKKYI